MKKTFVLIIASLVITGGMYALHMSAVPTKYDLLSDAPLFAWTATTHDFGKVKVGTPVSCEFAFTNDGKSPLVIASVKAPCGCTVASYTKEPVPPGGTGYVKATYDAARKGVFTKSLVVNANVETSVQLVIKGEVVE